MLVLVTPVTASVWVLVHSLQQPLGCQTMCIPFPPGIHREEGSFAVFTTNFAVHFSGIGLDGPYGSLPTQDILSVVSRIQPLQHQCMEKLQTRESIYKNGVWRASTLQQGWWGPYVLIAQYALLSGSTGVISVLVPALCHEQTLCSLSEAGI